LAGQQQEPLLLPLPLVKKLLLLLMLWVHVLLVLQEHALPL
jgi:hypothetical protein